MGNKGNLFQYFSMGYLGEDDSEKGEALSHLKSNYNLIDK